jgi:polyphosphate kinase
LGFCTPEQYEAFMKTVTRFEKLIVQDGIFLFKFYLDIGREMQLKRFHDRRHDPLKIWKLSPMDIAALTKWDDYTAKRDRMLKETDTDEAPWHVVRNNDKRRGRLEVIRHILDTIDYEGKDRKVIGKDDDEIIGRGAKFLK